MGAEEVAIMRLRLALIGLLTLSLPFLPSPAGAKPPKPHTLVVQVSGVPASMKTTLTVKGPHKYAQSFKTTSGRTVKHLRNGVYRVTASGLPGYQATVAPKKARLTKKHGARVRVRFAVQPPQSNDDDLQPIPDTPFPTMGAPRSISLVSASAAGTSGDALSLSPAWSPDGTRLAFASCAGNLVSPAKSGCYVFVKTPATGAISRLDVANVDDPYALTEGWSGELAWSPTADRVAFTTMRRLIPADRDNYKDVYVMDSAGGSLARPYTGLSGAPVPRADLPAWSPDGSKLLFHTSDTGLAPGAGDLLVNNGAQGPFTRAGSAESSYEFGWAGNSAVLFTQSTGESFGLFRQQLGAPAQSLLANLDTAYFEPTADGSRVAVLSWNALMPGDTNENNDIYVLPLAGGAPQRLSVDALGQQTLWNLELGAWSPDGSKFAFIAHAIAEGWMLLVKDLATGSITQVTPPQYQFICEEWEPSEDGSPPACVKDVSKQSYVRDVAWSPDSTRLAFSATTNNLVPGDTAWSEDVFVATL